MRALPRSTATEPRAFRRRRAMLRPRMRFGAVRLLLTLVVVVSFLGLGSRTALGAEARVRVRGTARVEASIATSGSRTELAGVVTDDTGRPVPSAKVQVRWTAPSGSALILPPHETCTGPSSQRARDYTGPAAEITVTADAWGRFCVRFPLELPDGNLVVGYVDGRGLLDGASVALSLTQPSEVELRFVPPPQTLSADREQLTLQIEARQRSGQAATASRPLTLSWHPDDAPAVVLGRRDAHAGELVRIPFATRELRAPGVGELRARFGNDEHATEAKARTMTAASVELRTQPRVEADSDGNAELEVFLDSRLGPPSSGSVEALAAGRTVGIGAVAAGRVVLTLRAGAGARPVPVKLRYLPSAPWWLPGAEQSLMVRVPPLTPLRRAPWVLALAALGAWVFLLWRRPRSATRRAERRVAAVHAGTPAVVWEPPRAGSGGYSGRVFDAHDGHPIAGAQVRIRAPEGEASAITDANGEFRLEGARAGGALHVSATWHASLDHNAPPPGFLSVALVTRRRALLARLVELSGRLRGASETEPTPGEVARHAAGVARGDVAVWARAVEGAVYGPDPVDADRQAAVSALEPRER